LAEKFGVARTLALSVSLALLHVADVGWADTLRVTTWNLQPAALEAKETPLPEIAGVLKRLEPDVILLQEVRDWRSCELLAQSLKPANYRVLICSAFAAPRTGVGIQRQVAVLAKRGAYLAWSQPWHVEPGAAIPGGFAFAAIEIRGQRLAFFSVAPADAAASARQVLEQVASVRNWTTNRVQLFVVGATFDGGSSDWPVAQSGMLRLFEGAGFGDVFLEAPAAERITLPRSGGQFGAVADYLFTQPPGCATNPRIQSNNVAEHYPVTCDLEFDPVRLASLAARSGKVVAASKPASLDSAGHPASAQRPAANAPDKSSASTSRLLLLALGATFTLLAVVWFLIRRARALPSRPPKLIPELAESDCGVLSSYTVVMGTQSGTAPATPGARPLSTPPPIIHLDVPATTQTQTEALRQRALAAEERAERATALIRARLLPHLSRWLKEKLLRKLVTDRAQLLEAQQAAAQKAMTVEERLARVERQIQQQNRGYQQRIEELTRELLAAKEENRELIRAQIRQVKAEMEAARTLLVAQAEREETE